MFEKALSLISRYDRIIIHRHNNPDGDAIGSQAGLKHLILENFKGKEVYAVGDLRDGTPSWRTALRIQCPMNTTTVRSQ